MTTLYDPPVKQPTREYEEDSMTTSSATDDDKDPKFEMAEYDLDVVDEALLNPHNKEYMDHFGFTIQVRTDDEASSDEDSSSFDEDEPMQPDNHTVTTTTGISDNDDDMSSIETNITSPHQSHSDDDILHSKSAFYPNTVPILKSPPTSINNNNNNSNKSVNRASIISTISNKFKRPVSVSSIPTSPATTAISRPSQTFEQRRSIHKSIGHSRSSVVIRKFTHYDHRYDSERQALLKQEALERLTSCRLDEEKIDWDFWSHTISNLSSVIESQMDDLRSHLAHGGIPSPIRGYVWQIISKSRDLNVIEYNELLKKTSSFEKQIQRDLTRTFPNYSYFMNENGRQALFRVAKAYSLFDQEVGYCQGLAFIIGCLLVHMSEEEAFLVLIKLMGKYDLRGHFTPRMETLHQHMYQFDNVFQQKLPVVHRHMESEGVSPSMYASQWFITLCSYRCPIEMSFRIMDLLFIEGPQVLVQIALALIVRNQEHILKLKFDALVDFLCNGIFQVYEDNTDGFVSDVYRIELPTKFMARLAQQYSEEIEYRDSRSTSQEDHLRRVNGQLSEHIRMVEGSLASLRAENKDLTQQIIDSKMDIARIVDEKEKLSHDYSQLKAAYENQVDENRKLAEKNVYLVNQLTDIENMLINMKLAVAEKEDELESLKQELKQAHNQLKQ